jgi:hypothetical protein
MAITTTYGNPRYGDQVTTVNFEGRVVSVDQVNERRNWSDTLDYSDWRMTDCTIATVYLGRYGAKDAYDRYDAATNQNLLYSYKKEGIRWITEQSPVRLEYL